MKLIFYRLNINFIKIDEQNVIHINNNNNNNIINKHKKINDNELEIQFLKMRCENIILNSKELLQVVQCFNKFTHFTFFIFDFKSRELHHINYFLDIVV